MMKTARPGVLMRRSLFALFLAFTGCVPAFAADAGACYAINDPDARRFCLAKARQDPAACYAIQAGDLRAQCLAEVRR